jgi:hypothetical protein
MLILSSKMNLNKKLKTWSSEVTSDQRRTKEKSTPMHYEIHCSKEENTIELKHTTEMVP